MIRSLLFLLLGIACLSGQPPVASGAFGLTGIVSSDTEGPMEGVLVSAKRIPGTITVTVASDSHGRYIFPSGRLAAGNYRLAIRAIGYDAVDPLITAAVGKGETEADAEQNPRSRFTAERCRMAHERSGNR